MNKINIKWSAILFFTVAFTFFSCSSNTTKDDKEDSEAPLENAFREISNLQGFEDVSKEIATEYSNFGEVQAVIAPNSKARDEVLAILDKIPEDLLCDEKRSGTNDKFVERYYIGENSDGEKQMLYAIVGTGGADLLVVLCSGADESIYRERVGKYK